MPFTQELFRYFDDAREHADNEGWFKAREDEYQRAVVKPFTELVSLLGESLSRHLPGIDFSPRKISRPLKRNSRLGEPVVRGNIYAHFSVPATSQFEMNPGLYISFGAADDENLFGAGIYTPSSRQMRLLRPKLLSDHKQMRKLLEDSELREFWGELAGERFKRFPKGLDETAPGAQYLWQKQFFLHRPLSREDILSAEFPHLASRGFQLAFPFLNWVRDTVGVYRPAARTQKGLDRI